MSGWVAAEWKKNLGLTIGVWNVSGSHNLVENPLATFDEKVSTTNYMWIHVGDKSRYDQKILPLPANWCTLW